MIKTEHEKEYCMKCGELNNHENRICKCGSRNFVFGNNFSYENKKVTCGCGNDKFQMAFHMNSSPRHTYNYRCSECNNTVGMETYSESSYI